MSTLWNSFKNSVFHIRHQSKVGCYFCPVISVLQNYFFRRFVASNLNSILFTISFDECFITSKCSFGNSDGWFDCFWSIDEFSSICKFSTTRRNHIFCNSGCFIRSYGNFKDNATCNISRRNSSFFQIISTNWDLIKSSSAVITSSYSYLWFRIVYISIESKSYTWQSITDIVYLVDYNAAGFSSIDCGNCDRLVSFRSEGAGSISIAWCQQCFQETFQTG